MELELCSETKTLQTHTARHLSVLILQLCSDRRTFVCTDSTAVIVELDNSNIFIVIVEQQNLAVTAEV